MTPFEGHAGASLPRQEVRLEPGDHAEVARSRALPYRFIDHRVKLRRGFFIVLVVSVQWWLQRVKSKRVVICAYFRDWLMQFQTSVSFTTCGGSVVMSCSHNAHAMPLINR